MKNLVEYLLEQERNGKGKLTIDENSISFDGSIGIKYTDMPILENSEDRYYSGCGPNWGTDMVGDRYHKLKKRPIIENKKTKNWFQRLFKNK